MSDWTQDHYVTRNSTTDDPSGYRVWLTCRCGWDSGTLVNGFMPTTHRAELEHYVSVAPLAEVGRSLTSEQEFYGAQYDRMIAAIEREAAVKALDDASYEIFVSTAEIDPGKRVAFHRGADAVYDALRARATAIRERKNDE